MATPDEYPQTSIESCPRRATIDRVVGSATSRSWDETTENGIDVTDTRSKRNTAEAIWSTGVRTVDSQQLVKNVVRREGDALVICDETFRVADINRIVVVGAGKAGAGMADGFEQAVGEELVQSKVSGWVNVPSDCVRRLKKIHLHAARPAGVNEPVPEGVEGTQQILKRVASLGANDLCIVLLSGGGSALLPAPADGISLDDKQAITRMLMESGATINELNCVRKQLSRVKGGGLARATSAGRLLTLIISDVIGDPLDVIASGPTVFDRSTPADALSVLDKHIPLGDIPASVRDVLRHNASHSPAPSALSNGVSQHVIGNNAVALEAAAVEARRLGYSVHSLGSDNQGEARDLGAQLAERCLAIRDQAEPLAAPACVLMGGESTVHLAPTDQPRKGGRNQELVLAGLDRLFDERIDGIVLLSGGTDGEDGPTDAAGAVADALVVDSARQQDLAPRDFLAINNSYEFFDLTGGLVKTGPTHTNVMDLSVTLVEPRHQ